MKTHTLVLLALGLGSLLASVIGVGLDRLGWLKHWETPQWTFHNHLLEVALGTRVILRSTDPEAPLVRLWFGKTVTEPELHPGEPPAEGGIPPLPYVLMGRETRKPGEQQWQFSNVSFALLVLMGARTSSEFLEEIRLVREQLPDQTSRPMLRVRFSEPKAAQIAYFYDIDDPQDPVPAARGFGWSRMEAYGAQRGAARIVFAIPDGRLVPAK